MISLRAAGALAISIACATGPIAVAQTASIQIIQDGMANGVSDDGSYVVGEAYNLATSSNQGYRWFNGSYVYVGSFDSTFKGSKAHGVSSNGIVVGESEFGTSAQFRAFRWQGTQSGGSLTLLPVQYVPGESLAHDVSDTGVVVVGEADWSYTPNIVRRAASWTNGGLRDLGPSSLRSSQSVAYGVSSDGTVITGQCRVESNDPHAFRWTVLDGMVDLGSLNPPQFGVTCGNAISADGTVIVGYGGPSTSQVEAAYWKGGVWTELDDFGSFFQSRAHDVSSDGRVTVGEVTFQALIWDELGPHNLYDYLESYGADMDAWSSLDVAYGCSRDGRVIVGRGNVAGVGWRSFRAYLPLPNREPIIDASDIAEGQTLVVKLGKSYAASIIGKDPDLDPLTISAVRPSGMTITPNVGTQNPSPLTATLAFTPTLAHEGQDYPSFVRFTDPSGDSVTRNFTISVPFNEPPTVTAPDTSAPIECNGTNKFELEAFVGDADSHHRLTVDWFVDDVKKKTFTNVVPATYSKFEYSYPLGESTVRIRVTDGYDTVQTTTLVTNQDTTSPVIVTPTQIVPTDKGKDYATKPNLPLPSVVEACDGTPTFSNDAPEILPLGQTSITWTVTDDSNNQSTAQQLMDVQDLEKPTIIAGRNVKTFVDRGQTFATVRLPKATATDNVTDVLTVNDNSRPRYPIGKTNVTYTCRDEAGNLGKKILTVTVVNRTPTANAGANVVVNTRKEKGALVRLSGKKSSDPDGHTLKYLWKTKGVRFNDPKSPTPQATFPVGKTNVTLTVTDEGGAKRTDSVLVTVRLIGGGSRRSLGADANAAFASASAAATDVVAKGGVSESSAAGYSYAAAADRYGLAAGEFVRWEDSQSESDGLAACAELRYYQAAFGQQASRELAQAFMESGDDQALYAAMAAGIGVRVAGADLLSQ